MSKEWTQMFSGGRFWPLHPERSAFNIQDIARGLAHSCRYNGQTERFYSVAEHSVHVSRIVQERAWAAGYGGRTVLDLARWGLLHDASEAHMSDLARPVKHLPDLAGYRAIEASVMRVIADRFGLSADEPDIVKAVDTEILGAEVAALLPNAEVVEWGKTTATGVLPAPIPGLVIAGWEPHTARRNFLERYFELWGRV